ncbi:MAG: hypothetical protein BWX88_05294 [Planctomycetes bacterium ADurb.Bin126]|nr:MAG: hypothetical protein BWX88_05294 [Planctomycetes bacterium ADurb.Bin126]
MGESNAVSRATAILITPPSRTNALATTPTAAARPLSETPRTVKAAPAPSTPTTTRATVVTSCLFWPTHSAIISAVRCTLPIHPEIMEAMASPTAMATPSAADIIIRKAPPSPESIILAVRSAAPPALEMASASCCICSGEPPSFRAPDTARWSNRSRASVSRSALGIFAIAFPTSLRTVPSGRRLPLASVAATPSSPSLSRTAGSAKRSMICRRVVPAIEPLMPMLARTPRAWLVDWMVSPASAATGATYDIASARSVSVWADPLAVAVSTSATITVSPAFRPKARTALAA